MVQRSIAQNNVRVSDNKSEPKLTAGNKSEPLRSRTNRSALLFSQVQQTQGLQHSLQWAPFEPSSEELAQHTAVQILDPFDAWCAKRMHFILADDPALAVKQLESVVCELLNSSQCELFDYNEDNGVFTSLSDEKRLGIRPRELNNFSDNCLSAFFHSDEGTLEEIQSQENKQKIYHACLMRGNDLIGLVAVRDVNPEFKNPQYYLELLAPYVALKVRQFQKLKQGLVLPHKQQVLTELSNRLVSAVDKESIITETLDVFWSRLGFGACQYAELSRNNYRQNRDLSPARKNEHSGVVLYEVINGRLKNFFHAGLMSKRHEVKDFDSIVSLLSSGWRKQNYLLLSGGQLGDKSLSSVFGVKNVQSALILPIIDVQTGKINATINVFQTKPIEISPETIDLLLTVMDLVANALGRATVLEKALAMATRDELTGIFNRRGFYERCQGEMDRSRRHPSPLCVALIDVDHFKVLNDTYGHLNGDIVLKTLAEMLSHSVRRTDVVSRFGGEEFALLLPDTSPEAAIELLERVRKHIEQLQIIGINQEQLSLTVSVGVSSVSNVAGEISNPADEAQTLISQALSQADIALYQSKTNGRNQVCSL